MSRFLIIVIIVSHLISSGACLTVRSGSGSSSTDDFFSSISAEPLDTIRESHCNTTCAPFATLHKKCSTNQHCGCMASFLQAQGDCLLCHTHTPEAAAFVHVALDAERNQCQSEGIKVDFELQVPAAATAIIQTYNHRGKFLRRQQIAFLVLQIAGGHIGLVFLLLLSILSPTVHHQPTYINFCVTWIFSSVVFSISLYHGTAYNTITNTLGIVNPGLCVTQAALITGAQAMTACSTMALVVQLWQSLRYAVKGGRKHSLKETQSVTIVLVVAPWIFFLLFALSATVIGVQQANILGKPSLRALPGAFYCIADLKSLEQAVYGMSLGVTVIAIIFDVLIIRTLYKNWSKFRHTQIKSAITMSALLRIVFFSIYRILTVIAYGTVLGNKLVHKFDVSGVLFSKTFGAAAWVELLQATVPLVAFLIFGANREVAAAVIFWRKEQQAV